MSFGGSGGSAGTGSMIGAVIGGIIGSFIPVVGTMLGMAIGGAIGGMIGGAIDPPSSKTNKSTPAKLNMPTSQYGVAIPIIYGTRIIPGNFIWYDNFKTIEHKEKSKGGKGLGGGVGTTNITYTYTVSFAVGLSVSQLVLLEIWKGRTQVALTQATFYNGSQNAPDPHIQQIRTSQGKTRTPTWKGLSYVVFKNFDLGTSPVLPLFSFKVSHAPAGTTSENPSDILKDILTNEFYGAGINPDYLNLTSFCDTREKCKKEDILLDVKIDTQTSVLDLIEYITRHHFGVVTYSEGLINYYHMHKDMQPVNSVTDADYVVDGEKPPVSVYVRGDRDVYNKVVVEYIKASRQFIPGTVYNSDQVDIDETGLREVTIKLDALSTTIRALRMANKILNKNMSRPKAIKARVGIRCRDFIKPGKQVYFSSAQTGLEQTLFTIVSVVEGEDYTIDIEAVEENLEDYNAAIHGSDTSESEVDLELSNPASPVIAPFAVEAPAYIVADNRYYVTFMKPDEPQWAGATLYKSYTSGSGFERVDSTGFSGITGVVEDVGYSEDVLNGSVYKMFMDVALNGVGDLESAVSMDSLLSTPNLNAMAIKTSIGTLFLRYENASIRSGTTWRLTGILYNIYGEPLIDSTGAVAINDEVAFFVSLPFSQEISTNEIGRTLYFKIASFNHAGMEADLSEATQFTLYNYGRNDKPLSPHGIKVNGLSIDSSNAISVVDGGIAFEWSTRNRDAIAIAGRTDVPGDDSDFQYFEIVFENSGTERRLVQQTAKAYTYTYADRISDGTTSPFTAIFRQVGGNGVSFDNSITITVA